MCEILSEKFVEPVNRFEEKINVRFFLRFSSTFIFFSSAPACLSSVNLVLMPAVCFSRKTQHTATSSYHAAV